MRIAKARRFGRAVAGAGAARQSGKSAHYAAGRDFAEGGTAGVGDINGAVPVRRHGPGIAKLGVVPRAVVGSGIAGQSGEGADLSGGGNFANRAVGHLGDIDIAQPVNCNSKGRPEPRHARRLVVQIVQAAVAARQPGQRRHRAERADFADGVVAGIGDIKVARQIRRHARRARGNGRSVPAPSWLPATPGCPAKMVTVQRDAVAGFVAGGAGWVRHERVGRRDRRFVVTTTGAGFDAGGGGFGAMGVGFVSTARGKIFLSLTGVREFKTYQPAAASAARPTTNPSKGGTFRTCRNPPRTNPRGPTGALPCLIRCKSASTSLMSA